MSPPQLAVRSPAPMLGFEALDDRVRSTAGRGVCWVHVAHVADTTGVVAHLVRRGATTQREVLAAALGVESGFRDIAQRLGLDLPHDPADAASAIARAARLRAALLVVPLASAAQVGGQTSRGWDLAVFQELASLLEVEREADYQAGQAERGALVIGVESGPLRTSDEPAFELTRYHVGRQLREEEARRWWEAFSEASRQRSGEQGLAQLERWSRQVTQALPGHSAAALSEPAWGPLRASSVKLTSAGEPPAAGRDDSSVKLTSAGEPPAAGRDDSSVKLTSAEGDATALPSAAEALCARLTWAMRAWPSEQLSRLLPGVSPELLHATVAQLSSAGVLEERDGLLWFATAGAGRGAASLGGEAEVATALAEVYPRDAWAYARAAELYWEAAAKSAGSGELTVELVRLGERMMRASLRLAQEAASRGSLWGRWRVSVDRLPEPERAAVGIRSAELGLALGDVDIALEWAERASGSRAHPASALVLGRAARARGDLVSAEAALTRARELSPLREVRAAALVELAEVKYAAGDHAKAEGLAHEALTLLEDAGAGGPAGSGAVADASATRGSGGAAGAALTQSARKSGAARAAQLGASPRPARPSVRLGARNLLGKLLLARAEWAAADAHFAMDACEAAFAGDRVAELRARVNRAIALLSRGSPDEARPILTDVLRDAEVAGELRAVGFALSNLAVLAIQRRDYREALAFSERAILVMRRLGERLGFATNVGNLVQLRLRLGLIDAAEQGLAFGRQALGPGAPAAHLAELSFTAARVHLERGRTLEAARELRLATTTPDANLGECHRLATRIALEEGALGRAEESLAHAERLAARPFPKAEVGVLRALVARAAGRPSLELGLAAVSAAREAGDEELWREAHVLVAELAVAQGDEALAAEHIRAAIRLRDQVAQNVGDELAAHYLARRDSVALSQLEAQLAARLEVEPTAPPPSAPQRALHQPRRAFHGRHPSVQRLLTSVAKVAVTEATVLVHGESGSGKELIAEALHSQSRRSSGPLVKVNCGALVETLLLSELFGHEKGAFTGANTRKLGRFERAHGGTLFLDEIGDISSRTQVALLRALEERSIERVGGTATIAVDVRIVCATHRDLRQMVASGSFREDLYYRLSGITLEVPALYERRSDLPTLCRALLEEIALERGEGQRSVSASALELLARHRWPGNVRELSNALRVASLFAEGPQIELEDFTAHAPALARLAAEAPSSRRLSAPAGSAPVSERSSFGAGPASSGAAPGRLLPSSRAPGSRAPLGGDASGLRSLDPAAGAYQTIREGGVSLSELKREIERECISRALTETSGNITRAATVLGMKRPRLSQLVKQYGLGSSAEPSEDEDV